MTHLQSSLCPFFSLRASEIPDAAEVTKAVELPEAFSLFQHRKEKKDADKPLDPFTFFKCPDQSVLNTGA